MDFDSQELKIVKITKDLGQAKYLSEDVFSKEEIGVKLSGKQRLLPKLPLESVIYVSIINSDKDNARYIRTWRNPFRMDNTETPLEKQRKVLDAQYIALYGIDKFDYLRVYSESKKFKDWYFYYLQEDT